MAKRRPLTPAQITALRGYRYVDSFVEGFAIALDGGGWFHVREDGIPLYRERYDEVKNFSARGRAKVRIGANWLLINRCGTKIPTHVCL